MKETFLYIMAALIAATFALCLFAHFTENENAVYLICQANYVMSVIIFFEMNRRRK